MFTVSKELLILLRTNEYSDYLEDKDWNSSPNRLLLTNTYSDLVEDSEQFRNQLTY